ncbi:hypothetical protein TSUD_146550 [Trifolium subterraneum]|uniref:Reverse transcriptase domain-containing protein n=1 Tax=Trifolium subterraneum TaxID=3900 RepID=A0A2Z6MW48_TRISU|nr:hypothetical protein TSUD_146550 [Trifolium subterraneum]
MGWEDGEWTVVQRRRRKERRQADRGFDGERRHRHHRSRSLSTLRLSFLHDWQRNNQKSVQDPNLHIRSRIGRHRSRSRTVLARSHNHGSRRDVSQLNAGFYHHRQARSQSRRPLESDSFRQQQAGRRQFRDVNVMRNPSSGFARFSSSSGAARHELVGFDSLGSDSKRYVSFYFTNFPAQLSRFYLRKGFEVCGMLEDVYVAKKLNKYGAPYGFVKFSNVRDVNKLSKALNAVYFGHYRVRARVARFDHNVASEERSSGMAKVGHKVGILDSEKEVVNLVAEGKASVVAAKSGSDTTDDVRVSDIVVRIGTPQEPTARKDTQSGLVSTVINGEAVPVVQNRLTDAGFHDLIIIPMGADKVFIRSTAGTDVLPIINSAKDFFTLVFSNWMRWGKEATSYRRGAWVRLYGIPIHAWNVNFFKLCVFDCGEDTCLFEEESESEASHTDNEMEHIDPVIRRDVDMVVGNLVDELAGDDYPELQENHVEDFKVKQVESRSAKEGIVEKEVQNDLLLSPSGKSAEVATSKHSNFQGDGREVSNNGSILVPEAQGSSFVCKPIDGVKTTVRVWRHEGSSMISFRSKRTNSCPPGANRSAFSGPWSLEWLNDINQRDAGVIFTASKRLKKGGHSGARQQKEGKQEIKRTKAGGLLRHSIHSLKKVARLPSKDRNEVLQVLTKNVRRRRGGKGNSQTGDLSTRLSFEDSTSSASVNNDWKHWVVMQGDDKAAEDDVRGFGKALGVRFNGDSENKFSVLTRTGKGIPASSRQLKRKGASKEKEWASGGLLSIWDSSEVEVWSTESREHVLWCHGRFIKSNEEFYVANVYAPCDARAKQRLWDSLSFRIQSLGRQRVCVCGDFNVVKSLDERRSLRGDGLSMSRLDRFLLSEEWCLTWPYCKQEARLRGVSDHCPLILSANEEDWGPRPSRMLKCWNLVPGYNKFVRDKWNSFQVNGWGGFVLKEKFKMIKGEENILSEAELEELHGEGDANSKYFHSVLASRRRGNAISYIVVDGVTVEGVTSVRQAVVSHFVAHFKTSSVVRPRVDDLLFKTLNHMECSSLIKPFTRDEVKAAVWDCDSFKSPGPDGINFGFIKDFWPELQGEVMRFIVEFHRNGKLTKGLNSTFIALIPKVDSPQCLNDFRPISLVGCLYKILAKVLANRLRLVIGSVISESQTAFVKDRQILDGILIANELVDEARKSKKELMLFKVDFEKAYDSVDWGYLDAVMGRMSFPNLWRKWIKECVFTATASVLVNGSPTDEFPLERGLRQGDPLSPFLFLLAAEGLNVLMKTMVERYLFSRYNVGEGAPISISHLQFADDTLLLWDKSWANVRALRAVLLLFESMSGLKVNFNKSMLVGVNIPESWLGEAAFALRCRVGKIPFIYLGLPVGGKWCWRMLVDREGLWYRVLVARYGVERGRLRDGGRRGSSWWREIARIRDNGGGIGGAWSGECIVKKVGDGTDTLFWSDPWVDGIPLGRRFRCLFDLAETQLCSVAEMTSLGWGAGGEAWVWRRPLRGWEEELLGECQSLLLNISLQDSVSLHAADGLIWHPQVPLKVSILAWRLLRDRLPTKANLVTRGILSPEAHFFVSGCGAVESAQHLFLSCSTFGPVWHMVSSWIGSPLVDSHTIPDHFAQFTLSGGGSRGRRSFMQLIWLVSVFGLYGMSEIPDVSVV